MQWLAQICVRRPVFASVLILALCVVGVVGYTRLGVDRFPDVDFPVVTVTTVLPGAAPEEVETELTERIEEAVNTIAGIDELTSVSSEGVSQVIITFVLEKDPDVAAQEVRDRLNAVLPDLPPEVELPTVAKIDPDVAPVLYLALSSDRPIVEMTEVADKRVRRDLERISGVGQVTIVGGRRRQINVGIDPGALRAHALTATDVTQAIRAQNVAVPGGTVETGPEALTVRLRGRVESPEALGRVVIRQEGGRALRVEDVARVEDGMEEATTAALRSGTPAVVLSIRKQSGTNTVAVVDEVRRQLGATRASLPPGYVLDVVRDDSVVIRNSTEAVREHLVVGAFFASLVVLLFLGNFRSTVIAAIAIPASIISTFGFMWIAGFTLNTLTLLALALAVGIVIDDAIVVLENIFRHVDEKGQKPFLAAVLGTREIGLAVLATTFSLLAVFIPAAFMPGIVGRFLQSFGLTMAFAIAISLVVSFTVTPTLAARWLKLPGERQPTRLERAVDRFYLPIERGYMRLLRWVMGHRFVVVLAGGLALLAIVPLFLWVPKSFLPVNDDSQFDVNVRAPEGFSLQATELAAERVARAIRELPGVDATVLTIGDDPQQTENLARIYVHLVPHDERARTQQQIMALIRSDVVPRQPQSLRINVSETAAFGRGGSTAAVQYVVSGPELDRLTQVADEMTQAFRAIPGAVDVESSLVLGRPELAVSLDRARAADLGVRAADIGSALRLLVAGEKISTYEEGGELYDVHARALPELRASEGGLKLLTVPSPAGPVALQEIASIARGEGPSEIIRQNRQRAVTVTGNVQAGVSEAGVVAALESAAARLLPQGYAARPIGRSRELGRAAQSFAIAFGMSLVFMYLVLAAQFESWLHPLTILLALPLTLPFALLSLFIFGQSLNINSALGLLVLFGVVKKNAILQIDHTNQLRARGESRLDAILHANRDRLRPILMTTLSFVAGMIPLITSTGAGAGSNRATAGVIVGGQTLALLLTLLATPVAYSLFDGAARRLRERMRRGRVPPDRGQADLDQMLGAESARTRS